MTSRGRPRNFDRDVALERAMLLFWERGYDTVSISQLTEAMDIRPPSLYASFTDKRTLFEQAVETYADRFGSYIKDALEQEPDAFRAVRRLLTDAAAQHTLPDRPAGCLILSGATNHAAGSEDVAAGLRALRTDVEDGIETLIAADIDEGTLPHGTNARALAAYVIVVWQGLSAAARDGHTREELLSVADRAMNAWPMPTRPKTRRTNV